MELILLPGGLRAAFTQPGRREEHREKDPALPSAESWIPAQRRGALGGTAPPGGRGKDCGGLMEGSGGSLWGVLEGTGGHFAAVLPTPCPEKGQDSQRPLPPLSTPHDPVQAKHPTASATLTPPAAALATCSSPSSREAQTQTRPGAGQQDLALQFY